MEYHKNDEVILDITDCGTDGEGIGKADGFTVFVKDAVIGDKVTAKIMKAKKNYGYARLMEVLEPSPYRVQPVCPTSRQCGGCQLQALSYEQQLVFKEKKVCGHLKRIAGFQDIPMEPILGMEDPFHYRNKAQFPIGRSKDGRVIAGFYAGRTHSIIENRDCALGVPQNKEVLDRVISHMEKYGIEPYDEITGKGLVRHVFVRYGFFTGELLVCLVINGIRIPHQNELVESLREIPGLVGIALNINRKRTNVILGDMLNVVWGQGYLTDKIGDITYEISPLSFFQVNPRQTSRLYAKALEYADLHGEETVWDLYCGTGTISLFLARQAKFVRGVEIIPAAIDNANRNAARNDIRNVEFFVGKAEEVLPREYEKNGVYADVIVVDPPRKGCDSKLLETIIKMQPRRVVYVSCDSATLARDLRYLCEKDYELKKVCPVDMFPQTVGVETVCKLVLRNPVTHVNIDVDVEELVQNQRGQATYEQIKSYVLEHFGLKISNLYIAQIKQKYGIIERENYNKPKSEDARVPQCPPEKERAITEALKHFGMIS